ncbi:orphan two-component response regulator [Escherichia coli]|nr:orphan two-component response regulator [Escherichia coli]
MPLLSKASQGREHDASHWSEKQILIVEDEQVFRSLLDSWFSSLGATTVLAADGVDALELLGGFTPDLMICDIAMPRMNGLKLLEPYT